MNATRAVLGMCHVVHAHVVTLCFRLQKGSGAAAETPAAGVFNRGAVQLAAEVTGALSHPSPTVSPMRAHDLLCFHPSLPAPAATTDRVSAASPAVPLPYLFPFASPRAHDPRFGTADNPIEVPSLLPERIIGVTDPLDDTLVIWSIVREGEPPRQLVRGVGGQG
jgi:hypothetical protein